MSLHPHNSQIASHSKISIPARRLLHAIRLHNGMTRCTTGCPVAQQQHFILSTSQEDLVLSIMAWLDGFFVRHPKLVLHTAQSLSCSRAVSASHETILDYFCQVSCNVWTLNILMQVYNIDEVGVNQARLSLKWEECLVHFVSRKRKESYDCLVCLLQGFHYHHL